MDPAYVAFLSAPGPLPSSIASGMRAQISKSLRAINPKLCPLLPLLTDSHCHVLGIELTKERLVSRLENAAMQVGHAEQYIFMSVQMDDWDVLVEQAWVRSCGATKIRLGYGIHPRWAHKMNFSEDPTVRRAWVEKLTSCLAKTPTAIVGEIGLDRSKCFRPYFESHQIPIFREQLGIAANLSRPVSVHCVKADAALIEVFQTCIASAQDVDGNAGDGLPPALCLHSFGGSIETLKRIITVVEGTAYFRNFSNQSSSRQSAAGDCTCAGDLEKKQTNQPAPRVYVGFNPWTNLHKKDAAHFVHAIIKETRCGECRMLIESDWDFPKFEGSCPRHADKMLLNGLGILCDILGWEPAALASRLRENTRTFLRTVQV